MGRRFFRKRHGNRDKYSVEHTSLRTSVTDQWDQVDGSGNVATSFQQALTIVDANNIQGMRKVKHITLTASNPATAPTPIYFVLAYVPQGYDPQHIVMPNPGISIDSYPANQYVMQCGWLDFDGGPLRIRTRLSRNLNSGDSIVLILASYSASNQVYYVFDCTYAITLQ